MGKNLFDLIKFFTGFIVIFLFIYYTTPFIFNNLNEVGEQINEENEIEEQKKFENGYMQETDDTRNEDEIYALKMFLELNDIIVREDQIQRECWEVEEGVGRHKYMVTYCDVFYTVNAGDKVYVLAFNPNFDFISNSTYLSIVKDRLENQLPENASVHMQNENDIYYFLLKTANSE